MKNKIIINTVWAFVLVMVVFLPSSCKKDSTETSTVNDPTVPAAFTDTASYISQEWATLNCLVGAGNLPATISFDYDTDTTQAYRYNIPANPDTLTGHTSTRRIAELTGLTPSTAYYYRVRVVNSMGTTLGSRKSFTTLDVVPKDIVFNPDLTYGEVSDADGKVYKTIEIGTQFWMAENLATTKYNDGTDIPLVTNTSSWATLTTGAYSWYSNTEIKYGILYNWHAVNSGKLCPAGWHVSTDEEWTTLTNALGGLTVAAGKLKESGTIHWLSQNTGATNSSGFTALPGGYRYYNGVYNAVRRYGYWWTSTESSDANAFGRDMYYGYINIDRINSDKSSGASVRCVKD